MFPVNCRLCLPCFACAFHHSILVVQTATNVTKQAAFRLPLWEHGEASGGGIPKRPFILILAPY